MIWIIFGQDRYLVKKRIEELADQNKNKPGPEQGSEKIFIDSNDKNFDSILRGQLNNRLIGANPLIIVKNSSKLDLSQIKNLILGLKQTKINIVFQSETKPEELIKNIKKRELDHAIEEVKIKKKRTIKDSNELVKSLLDYYQVRLPNGFQETFSKIFLNNPELLETEIKKLSFFQRGRTIAKTDLVNLVRWPNESRIWDMIDSLLEKDWSKFTFFLKRELNLGSEPTLILANIKNSLVNLLLVKLAKSKNELKSLNLNEYYKFKLSRHENNFQTDEIKKLIKTFAQIDQKYKKFRLKSEEIPSELIYQLSESNFSIK